MIFPSDNFLFPVFYRFPLGIVPITFGEVVEECLWINNAVPRLAVFNHVLQRRRIELFSRMRVFYFFIYFFYFYFYFYFIVTFCGLLTDIRLTFD